MRRLGSTELEVSQLCLGGNVFGWTADEEDSFAVLDAYVGAGGNFVDSADSYSAWAPGHRGGESEEIIGRWLAARRLAGEVIIATKVGKLPGREGLAPANLRSAAEDSLRRLGVDRIDLYYAHLDDESTPLDETLATFEALAREGKIGWYAASNYSAKRLAEALDISEREGLTGYVAIQPHYNLLERDGYEGEMADLCSSRGIACVPYFGLARGFLTGKYRRGVTVDSPRAAVASGYLDERGERVLAVLDEVAAARGTTVAAVALAWLADRPTVVSPIASARNVGQLADLLPVLGLHLTAEETEQLDKASA
jgi:aryl-alcohol dehydrogenase-like predicted oxidoreductase